MRENQPYLTARIGASLDSLGHVIVVAYSCGSSGTRLLEARTGQAIEDLRVVWSAAATPPNSGLVMVVAAGGELPQPGWRTTGEVASRDGGVVYLHTYFGARRTDFRRLSVTPTELSTEHVTVDPSSYSGADSVSVEQFVRMNEGWCQRGRP